MHTIVIVGLKENCIFYPLKKKVEDRYVDTVVCSGDPEDYVKTEK